MDVGEGEEEGGEEREQIGIAIPAIDRGEGEGDEVDKGITIEDEVAGKGKETIESESFPSHLSS